MAEIVLTLGVPHTPLLWRTMQEPIPDDLAPIRSEYQRLRTLLDAARPDVIVMVASDHFRQLGTSNMPAFLIGKVPTMRGTHPNEERHFGMPRVDVPGDVELAAMLLGGRQLPDRFDFSFSDELWLDHAYIIPLLYLRPELDIPVVPVNTNCNAPPIPSARRFAQLGSYLRDAITCWSDNRRVAVVGSGHLAFELGGPRQFSGGSPGPEFDQAAVEWIATGDVEGAVAGCSFDRMLSAGNLSFQYLNFLTCLTAAGGVPATSADGVMCRFGAEPFFVWETP